MRTYPIAPSTPISSGYGPRGGAMHHGLDFACPVGTPLYAAADGVVVQGRDRAQGSVSGFGSWIWIDCQASESVDLIYGHVTHPRILVRRGDRVRAGQLIGYSGNEGITTGPHLHFEVWGPPGRQGGTSRDPRPWLQGAADPTKTNTPTPAPEQGGSMSGNATWLADVLRAAGLKVIEQPGWKTRGHGTFKTITHVMWHHTAGGGDNDWYWVQHGTNGLAGPLSQLVLERDGTFRVIAAGVAWHAGVGSWPGLPTNNGNWHSIGIEAVNNGRGQAWPAVQREAYRLGTAAILKRLGRDENGVVAHKEYGKIQGKIDPFPFDMDDERRRVRALLRGTPPAPVRNEIDHYASQPAHAWIGKRLTPAGTEVAVGPAGRGGRAVEYESAIVYWSPTTGAHAVPRADPALGPTKSGLLEEFQRRGGTGGPLGFPIREFTRLLDNPRGDTGAVQSFEGGVLYRQDGQPRGWPVFGKIGEHWARDKYENGPGGYPTSDEYPLDGGFIAQDFQHDRLVFSPSMVVPESVLAEAVTR